MKKTFTLLAAFLIYFTGFSQNWLLTGNAGTNSASNFVGTTDTQRLVFRTNNTEKMTILQSGNVGIGTTTPFTLLNVFSNIPDNHLRVAGNGPSVQLINGPTANPSSHGVLGLSNGPGYYLSNCVANDLVLQNLDTAASLIFGTNRTVSSGIERMRINSSGYVGISTTSPTAKLHVNCTAVTGKTNPSNIRFENLQKGGGSYLVIDSNGYVYRTTSGAGSSAIKADPLTVDLQNQVESLQNQVQELRALIQNSQSLSPLQANALKSASAAWLGNNRPNPSTNSTTIDYSLPPEVTAASCQVYSLDGKLINAINLSPSRGKGQVQLGTNKMPSGLYIYSLIVNGKVVDTKKMVVGN